MNRMKGWKKRGFATAIRLLWRITMRIHSHRARGWGGCWGAGLFLVMGGLMGTVSGAEPAYDPSHSVYPLVKGYKHPEVWGLTALQARTAKVSDAQKSRAGVYQTERVIFRDPDLGGEIWKLTQDNVNNYHWYQDMSPWNSNGSKIMFKSERSTSKCLIMDGDATNARDYTTENGLDSARPCWSRVNPDLHYSLRGGILYEHNILTAKSRELAKIAAKALYQGPSPDGRYILCYGGGPGYLYDIQTGKAAALDVMRNADDERLKGKACKQDEGQLVGDKEHPVRYDEDNKTDAGWFCVAADGFTSAHAFWKRNEPFYTKFKEGKHPGHPSWSPDGSRMIYYDRERQNGIKLISKDGSWEKYLVNNEGNGHTTWLHGQSEYAFAAPSIGKYFAKMLVRIYATDEQQGTVHCLAFHGSDPEKYGKGKKSDYFAQPRLASSPDGTKVFWTSNALGTKDVYFVVAKHPDPPADLVVINGKLRWTLPVHRNEIKGTLVYCAAESGGPYNLLTPEPVAGTEFQIPIDAGPCFVTSSIEYSGLESRVYSNEAHARTPAKYRLYFQAESGNPKVPIRLDSDFLATGDLCVWASPGPASSFSIPVHMPKDGSFILWARTRGAPGEIFSFNSGVTVSAATAEWTWIKAGTVNLSKGAGVLQVSSPKGGSARLDAVCLSNDSGFTPSGPCNLDAVAPEKPSCLSAQPGADGSGTVALTWSASKDPNFSHYEIHCSETPEWTPSNASLLFSPPVSVFEDWGVPKGTRHYRIIAVDRSGNRSPASEVAKAICK